MEKQGYRYLRYALFNVTKLVCIWNPVFADYLAKKRSEGSTTMLLSLTLPRNQFV